MFPCCKWFEVKLSPISGFATRDSEQAKQFKKKDYEVKETKIPGIIEKVRNNFFNKPLERNFILEK